jgi:hypothetical protein
MRRRLTVVEDVDRCTHCPHSVVGLSSGTFWCPCEDCHPGGLIQGREPRILGTTPVTPTSTPVTPTNEDGPLWVDPIHSV